MRILIAPQLYKQVDWHGLTLFIPHNHVAVAADSNGWVYSYATIPEAGADTWLVFSAQELFDICQVDLEGTDWRTTLVEYPL